jgi:ABC-type iron transport system FetAB ATPase subunit
LLTIRGLTCPGLAPFDLELVAGEAVVVLGPSGSGKSILLRAIADLDPNDGFVALGSEGRATMAAPEWRRRVTYLVAESGWWDEKVLAHFNDVAAGRRLFPALNLANAAMEWDVSRLSTGERQRLALARVFAQKPEVMLLDEPTSGLDAEVVRAVEAVLQECLQAGAGMLFVTHDEGRPGAWLSAACVWLPVGQRRVCCEFHAARLWRYSAGGSADRPQRCAVHLAAPQARAPIGDRRAAHAGAALTAGTCSEDFVRACLADLYRARRFGYGAVCWL